MRYRCPSCETHYLTFNNLELVFKCSRCPFTCDSSYLKGFNAGFKEAASKRSYMRVCERCGKAYKTVNQGSTICTACYKPRGTKREMQKLSCDN